MIRQGAVSDLDGISRIERSSYTSPWSEAQIRGEMENGSFFVQDAGGEAGGYVFFRTAADEMEITNIAVAPGKRRLGIGRGLLKRAMEEGKKKGVKKVFLEVRTTNGEARPLYESLGFKRISERKAYYGKGEDALVLYHEL